MTPTPPTPRLGRSYLLRDRSLAKVLRMRDGWITAEVKVSDGTRHRERFTVKDFARQIVGFTTHAARAAWKLASIRAAIEVKEVA